jgi:hypothetical protein
VQVIEAGGLREQQKAVRQLLHQLVNELDVPPAEIVILTGHKNEPGSAFPSGLKLGNFTLTGADPPPAGQILASTAERDVRGVLPGQGAPRHRDAAGVVAGAGGAAAAGGQARRLAIGCGLPHHRSRRRGHPYHCVMSCDVAVDDGAASRTL